MATLLTTHSPLFLPTLAKVKFLSLSLSPFFCEHFRSRYLAAALVAVIVHLLYFLLELWYVFFNTRSVMLANWRKPLYPKHFNAITISCLFSDIVGACNLRRLHFVKRLWVEKTYERLALPHLQFHSTNNTPLTISYFSAFRGKIF